MILSIHVILVLQCVPVLLVLVEALVVTLALVEALVVTLALVVALAPVVALALVVGLMKVLQAAELRRQLRPLIRTVMVFQTRKT
jgi:hypothetical protein